MLGAESTGARGVNPSSDSDSAQETPGLSFLLFTQGQRDPGNSATQQTPPSCAFTASTFFFYSLKSSRGFPGLSRHPLRNYPMGPGGQSHLPANPPGHLPTWIFSSKPSSHFTPPLLTGFFFLIPPPFPAGLISLKFTGISLSDFHLLPGLAASSRNLSQASFSWETRPKVVPGVGQLPTRLGSRRSNPVWLVTQWGELIFHQHSQHSAEAVFPPVDMDLF